MHDKNHYGGILNILYPSLHLATACLTSCMYIHVVASAFTVAGYTHCNAPLDNTSRYWLRVARSCTVKSYIHVGGWYPASVCSLSRVKYLLRGFFTSVFVFSFFSQIHPLNQRRRVLGRSRSFNELLEDHRRRKKLRKQGKPGRSGTGTQPPALLQPSPIE